MLRGYMRRPGGMGLYIPCILDRGSGKGFCLSHERKLVTRIMTLYQAVQYKKDKILIKNLYECKGYNV